MLADAFNEKRKAGTVQAHGTGYGGTGFKFDTTEEEERRAARKVRANAAMPVILESASFAAVLSLFAVLAPPAPCVVSDCRAAMQLVVPGAQSCTSPIG